MTNLHHLHDGEELGEIFRKYLKDHGIKNTSARQKILAAVLDLHEHFEAEQVLYHLREKNEKVSKATVYRTLPFLVDCGILKQVRFEVKQAHYEHAFGEGPHDHMVCRRCGRITEFASEELLDLGRRPIGAISKARRPAPAYHLKQKCACVPPVQTNAPESA